MILSYLCGECRFAVPMEESAFLAELCRTRGFLLYAQERDEKKGEFLFSCRLFAAKRLSAFCRSAGISLREISRRGVPVLLQKILHRPGLLAGGAAALLILLLSPLFLWEVEITGNESIPREEIERELVLSGLSRGSFLPRVDADAVASNLRRADARLAYVAVNLRGTVAAVQVREAEPEPAPPPTAPANLVAGKDGVVILPLVYEGKCLVREGDVVRAGQILASGILDTENNGTRITRASGEVLARTVRTYTVFVPFDYTVQVPAEQEGKEISLLFFGKAQKVLKITGNATDKCDIIYYKNWWTLPGGRTLPFGFAETRTVYYTDVAAHRDTAEALAVAKAELSALLAADSASYTLLQKTTETVTDGTGVTLVCTVVCEENIAVSAEFAVSDGTK